MIVHLVTDRRRLAGASSPEADARQCLIQQARFAIAAGVDLIQIREADLEARSLTALVEEIVSLAKGTSTRVVVNDRLDVALAARADGVHLRANSISPREARRLAPAPFLLGRSVHSVGEAQAAAGADYLVAGTVWASASKLSSKHRLLGVDGFASIAKVVDVPVLAIGGLTSDRVGDVARAGGAGIAAIGLFAGGADPHGCRASDLCDTMAHLRRMFDTSTSRS